MLRAIEFDHEFLSEADEVDDVWSDGCLATEFVAVDFSGAQKMPEAAFGFDGLVAQLAREVALGWVAVHGVCEAWREWVGPWQCNPLPNPPRKGEGAGRRFFW